MPVPQYYVESPVEAAALSISPLLPCFRRHLGASCFSLCTPLLPAAFALPVSFALAILPPIDLIVPIPEIGRGWGLLRVLSSDFGEHCILDMEEKGKPAVLVEFRGADLHKQPGLARIVSHLPLARLLLDLALALALAFAFALALALLALFEKPLLASL